MRVWETSSWTEWPSAVVMHARGGSLMGRVQRRVLCVHSNDPGAYASEVELHETGSCRMSQPAFTSCMDFGTLCGGPSQSRPHDSAPKPSRSPDRCA